MTDRTFSIRLPRSDHELLTALAVIHGRAVAAVAREIFAEGIHRRLEHEGI
jgi:predicted DNA-binding protein